MTRKEILTGLIQRGAPCECACDDVAELEGVDDLYLFETDDAKALLFQLMHQVLFCEGSCGPGTSIEELIFYFDVGTLDGYRDLDGLPMHGMYKGAARGKRTLFESLSRSDEELIYGWLTWAKGSTYRCDESTLQGALRYWKIRLDAGKG